MKNELIYKNLIAFHPGSYIMDLIDDLNITQKEFAHRLGTTEKSLSKLINGECNLSNEMASKLSKITGTSIDLWINLQREYDKKILDIEEQKRIDELELCQKIDFNYFKINNFVDNKRYSINEKIQNLRKILHLSDLLILEEFNYAVSYRNSNRTFDEKAIINSNIMLEIASNKARNVCDIKLNKNKLRKYLPEIKSMTIQEPRIFYKRLKEILFSCGIVLIALPNLKNAKINGATKKFKNGSVLLLITDRNKSSDIFWFSIMHEISHILDSDFGTDYKDEETYYKKEDIADKFARNFFIEDSIFDNFTSNNDFSKKAIISFAKEQGIHPSIVLGRLQNQNYCSYNELNELKEQYYINI